MTANWTYEAPAAALLSRLIAAKRSLRIWALTAIFVTLGSWTAWHATREEPVRKSLPSLPDQTPGDLHPVYAEGLKILDSFDRPGDLDRAVNLFTDLVAKEPTSAPAQAGLAKALWHKFRLTRERSWLDRAIRLNESYAIQVPGAHAAMKPVGAASCGVGDTRQPVSDSRQGSPL